MSSVVYCVVNHLNTTHSQWALDSDIEKSDYRINACILKWPDKKVQSVTLAVGE